MQWAIRNRESNRSSLRITNASNLVFIDPNALRRSTTSAAVAAASQEAPTMATTSSSLARAFGIVMRQISELLAMLPYNELARSDLPPHSTIVDISYNDALQLQKFVEKRLKPIWEWILTVMDATEAQLKFGASLTDSAADPANPLRTMNSGTGVGTASSSNNNTTSSATLGGAISVLGGE
jgi:E3 ubiquitin-protein ligase EDD1